MDYLDYNVFGVPLLSWLLMLAVWAVVVAGLVLVRRFLRWRARRLKGRLRSQFGDLLDGLAEGTRLYFLIAVGLYAAMGVVELPAYLGEAIRGIVLVILLLQVGQWGNTFINLWTDRYKEKRLEEDAAAVTTMQAVGFLGRILLWAVLLLVGLENFGVNVTALIAGLGVGGIAVAFALQSILGDLFASLAIVLDKPFVVGDFLIVGDFLGTVEHVGLKTTRLRSLGGEQIIFSNSDLLSSRIRNYKRMYERRVVFSVGAVYQTPHEKIKEIPTILREAVEAQDRTRFDRAHFKEYGSFALNFEVVYYVLSPEYNVYMDIQQAVNLFIHRRFEEEGIEFAYPTQQLYISKGPETELVEGSHRPDGGAQESTDRAEQS